jgi:hopene-associated glycosyltransferase HpnB
MFLVILATMALCAWAWIGLIRIPFYRPVERLSPRTDLAAWPPVIAVIPARNEGETIAAVIRAHLRSDYLGRFDVVLVDDHSNDGTSELAFAAAVETAGAPQRQNGCLLAGEFVALLAGGRSFALKQAPPLPLGWTGKMWAVNAGLGHATKIAADARYVLLCDADIVMAPDTLTRLVAAAETKGVALASLMSRLDARGLWGGLLIPAFVFFFQKLYPFQRVNDDKRAAAAAAGGCMLVRRDVLDEIGGVVSIRNRIIDDCALAAAIKESGRPVFLGLASDEAISLRDNRKLDSIWRMVERTAFTQLDRSWLNLAGAVVGMVFLYLLPPALALGLPIHGEPAAASLAASAWALMSLSYIATLRVYEQPSWRAFLLPAAAALYTVMTISSAICHATGKGGAWKGRTYPA